MKPYPHTNEIPQTEAEWMQALVALVRFLRGPEGCPWDRAQTSEGFARFVQEEAGELVEAYRGEDANEHIEEEWGDTLFTLLAAMAAAETEGRFALAHALERAHEKMVRRHGHIFGVHTAENPEDVVAVWRQIKEREKREKEDRP